MWHTCEVWCLVCFVSRWLSWHGCVYLFSFTLWVLLYTKAEVSSLCILLLYVNLIVSCCFLQCTPGDIEHLNVKTTWPYLIYQNQVSTMLNRLNVKFQIAYSIKWCVSILLYGLKDKCQLCFRHLFHVLIKSISCFNHSESIKCNVIIL